MCVDVHECAKYYSLSVPMADLGLRLPFIIKANGRGN